MKRRDIYFILTFVIICGQLMFAQSVEDILRLSTPGVAGSARSLGMGNSFYSVSDDAEASVFNPAGMALVRKMEISGGLNYDKFSNTATFMGEDSKNSNSKTNLGQLSFVMPFPTARGSFALGLSYNETKNFLGALSFNGFNPGMSKAAYLATKTTSDLPVNLGLCDASGNTNITNQLQQYGTSLDDGLLHTWDITAAVEVARNLYLGATLGISSGSYTSDWNFNEADVLGLYSNVSADPNDPANTYGFQSFRTKSSVKWDISGVDFKLGLLYQLGRYGRFGATIAFPKSYTVKEDYSTVSEADFARGVYYADNYADHVEYDITTPYEFSVGGSFNMSGLLASADITYIDYTSATMGNPSGISDLTVSDINAQVKQYLKSVVNYNLGVEYTFPDIGFRLRAGFFTQQSPYDGDPSSFNRKYITGGCGFLVDNSATIDMAVAHGTWKSVGDNYGYDYSRTYQDISDTKFIASFSYRF